MAVGYVTFGNMRIELFPEDMAMAIGVINQEDKQGLTCHIAGLHAVIRSMRETLIEYAHDALYDYTTGKFIENGILDTEILAWIGVEAGQSFDDVESYYRSVEDTSENQ